MSCRNLVLCRNLLLVSALFVQVETLYRAENSVFFRNLLLVSALFAQAETLCRAETLCFAETFCLFQPYLLKAKPYIVPKTRCSSETFCLFQPYLFKSKPSFFVELGAVVHQRETSARFCHQRKLASLFRHFLPFRLFAQLRRFCVCEKLNINIYLHIPQRSGGRSRQQGQGGRGVFIKTG